MKDRKIALDVESDNKRAIEFYKRMGYEIERKSKVVKPGEESFCFYRMSKKIERI